MKAKRAYFTIDGLKLSKAIPEGWRKLKNDEKLKAGDKCIMDEIPYEWVDIYDGSIDTETANYYYAVIREEDETKKTISNNTDKIVEKILNHLDGKQNIEIMMGPGNGFWLNDMLNDIAELLIQDGKAHWEDQNKKCFSWKLKIFRKGK
jgi:hypothetical protein